VLGLREVVYTQGRHGILNPAAPVRAPRRVRTCATALENPDGPKVAAAVAGAVRADRQGVRGLVSAAASTTTPLPPRARPALGLLA
jgi:hypothetical protein